MITGDMQRKFQTNVTLDALIASNKAYGLYEDLDEVLYDLEEILHETPAKVTFVAAKEGMNLYMEVDFNGRAKKLGFFLPRIELPLADKNRMYGLVNHDLKMKLHKIQMLIQQKDKQIEEHKKKFGLFKHIQLKYQFLKCWICQKNKHGEMTICRQNLSDQVDTDTQCNGFSALCPDHKSQIGKTGNYRNFDEASCKLPNAAKLQQLCCYFCGKNQSGKMLVCKNLKGVQEGKSKGDINIKKFYYKHNKTDKIGYSVLCPNCKGRLGDPGVEKLAIPF